jgi:nitroimidazol reductase NimA-like FMN-containing flavoprotein (pyridoxamine 5'-phosphate oxidase superfamily)
LSRRDLIRMDAGELAAFLDEQRTLTLATLGRDGWPHLMPLWYAMIEGVPWAWTYAKSQKVRNLERDPRCTIQVEAGTEYGELRGVMAKAECELTPEQQAGMRRQAAKRVGLRLHLREVVTWDHRKLGGTY